MRRLLLGAALVLATLTLWPASPAGAHAELVGTTPGDGARLTEAPTEVTLTFNEGVSAALGAVRVLDREGRRVDTGDVEARGPVVSVGLEDLDDGAYVVAWRAVSADSHPIHGSTTFVVGDTAERLSDDLVQSLIGGGGDGGWRIVGMATRLAAYGGALLATGLAVFLTWAHDGGDERSRLRRVLRVAAGVGALGLLAELPVRAALATGLGPRSLTETGVARQLLGDRVGIGLVVALLTLLFVAVDGGRDRIVAAGATVALAVALALSGHTATGSVVVATVADAAHVAAGAVWFGGLVGCALVARSRRGVAGGATPVVLRFSGPAAVALAGVTVGGAVLGWTQVRSLDALTSTPYGRLLIAKVVVVGLAAAIGGLNRLRLLPVLQHTPDHARATTLLRRAVGAEAALLLLVIGATAVLVDVTPAKDSVAGPYAAAAPLGDGRVEIDVSPTRAGRTTIHVYAYDAGGDPLPVPDGLSLVMSLPANEVTGIERRPVPTGTGHWTLLGDDLSIGGTWTIEVVARVSDFEQETATFTVPIRP